MTLKDICQLALEKGVKISFGPIAHDIKPLVVIEVDIRKNDYHISQYVPLEHCEKEQALEYVINRGLDSIRKYEEAKSNVRTWHA